ncbi:MAG TPA: hypothetical protein PK016_03770 [Candidatus Atribacteria bacterium]|nr:hypothetical protein [Candidatus Atribacteria bacterium]
MNKKTIFFIVVGILVLGGSISWAQAPLFREQLVYSLTSFNGSGFSSSFCPQSEGTLYFIANFNSVVSPRKTIVYYWPITRRYMAGFSTLNEEVPGKLEIWQGGKLINTLDKQKYVLYYPEGYWSEKATIYLDDEAQKYYDEYKAAVDEFNKKLQEYYQAMNYYQQQLNNFFEEVRRRREAGDTGPLDIPIPQQPEPPEFVKFYVTEPAEGFILNLPVGNYEIKVRMEDGTIFEGSEKNLIVFTSRRREGVGYEIIPGNRWTKRENCDDPSWIIHAVGKNELYFNPFYQEEYNELYYNKLQDPQNIGRLESWKWVHVDPVNNAQIILGRREEILQTVDKAPYFVRQVSGPELGYEILPYDEELKKSGYQPTFESYKVTLGEDLPRADYQIYTISRETGEHIPKSERTIRFLKKENGAYLYAVAFLPLVVGAIAIIGRSYRVEK